MTDNATPTYLTTEELAVLIRYDARTIRNRLRDSVLLEGIHYIRPFGGRKILFIREAIERDLNRSVTTAETHAAADKVPAAATHPDVWMTPNEPNEWGARLHVHPVRAPTALWRCRLPAHTTTDPSRRRQGTADSPLTRQP